MKQEWPNWNKRSNMTYKILEHDKAKKFKRKHKTDKQLILRIEKKYIEIIKNPYKPSFLEMKSDKCPKCRRARVGDYRIVYFISEKKNLIEIIDIIPRSNDYRLF